MFQKYCVVFQELFVVFADVGHRRKVFKHLQKVVVSRRTSLPRSLKTMFPFNSQLSGCNSGFFFNRNVVQCFVPFFQVAMGAWFTLAT